MAASNSSTEAVGELFSSVEKLQNVLKDRGDAELLKDCTDVIRKAEVVGERLAYNIERYTSSQNDMLDVSSAFWRAVHSLAPLKKEVVELRKFTKDMKLAEAGIDPRPIELGEVKGISQSTSYEDLKQSKLQKAGGSPASNSGTSTPSFGIRKARSDPDVNKHNLQKEIESMKVDIQRFKKSEKKLLKDTQILGRKCKLLEEERDRAEDRLKIEQTQRDSIEKLRQRNRELEEQVQKLRQRQVIKEKEQENEEIKVEE